MIAEAQRRSVVYDLEPVHCRFLSGNNRQHVLRTWSIIVGVYKAGALQIHHDKSAQQERSSLKPYCREQWDSAALQFEYSPLPAPDHAGRTMDMWHLARSQLPLVSGTC